MQLFIPALSTILRLTEPWNFRLYREERNRTLWEMLIDKPMPVRPLGVPAGEWTKVNMPITLDIDQVLQVDRVYIRKGASHYNSVTFKAMIEYRPNRFRSARWWVTLADANKIKCEVV